MYAMNEGTVDRWLRVFGGCVLLGFGVMNHTPLGLVGLVPLITGASTQLPQVREFLFSWVTPLLRAFVKN